MKSAISLTALGLLLAGYPALAQNPPPKQNHWDITKIDVSKLPAASDKQGVTFETDILPLFKASCVRCHGEEKPRGGLKLTTLEDTLKGGKQGKMVVPGDSKSSLLVAAAARIDDNIAMPPKRRPRGGGGGGAGGPPPAGGETNAAGGGTPPPGGPPGPGGPGRNGPPPKPLTETEVGLIRAWIDQGAK